MSNVNVLAYCPLGGVWLEVVTRDNVDHPQISPSVVKALYSTRSIISITGLFLDPSKDGGYTSLKNECDESCTRSMPTVYRRHTNAQTWQLSKRLSVEANASCQAHKTYVYKEPTPPALRKETINQAQPAVFVSPGQAANSLKRYFVFSGLRLA